MILVQHWSISPRNPIRAFKNTVRQRVSRLAWDSLVCSKTLAIIAVLSHTAYGMTTYNQSCGLTWITLPTREGELPWPQTRRHCMTLIFFSGPRHKPPRSAMGTHRSWTGRTWQRRLRAWAKAIGAPWGVTWKG